MNAPPARLQAAILGARYRACWMGDLGTLAVLLLQAPFIGWLCTLVWGSVETDTPSLYFVLSLSALWFGCINACREIVKERAIVERERLLGLSLPAYVQSRFSVLSWVGLAQVLLLQGAVEWSLALRGPFLLQTLSLWLASLCGTGLGLLISALSKSQERAVGVVPLLILPQILFSEFAIPRSDFGTVVTWVERFMPVHACYAVFLELADVETRWGVVVGWLLALFAMAAVLGVMATLSLVPRREIA